MPQLDPSTFASQLFWLAVFFILLYLLMAQIALPRVANILQNRKEKISNDLDEANRLAQEVEDIEKAYDASMREASDEANHLINQAVADSEAKTQARRKELDAKIGKQLAEADKKMQQAKADAEEKVETLSVELSQLIVNRIAGLKVSETDSKKKVKDKLPRKVA